MTSFSGRLYRPTWITVTSVDDLRQQFSDGSQVLDSNGSY